MSQSGRTRDYFGLPSNPGTRSARREGDHDAGCEGPDHLASIYSSRSDQFETVVPFVRAGLERGERCVYVAHDNDVETVADALRDGGIDVAAAREEGALAIHTEFETYLRTGEFDPDEMLAFWEDALADARGDFDGLRAAAEMTWAVDATTGLDTLCEYEAMLNPLYEGDDYTVLCQYNRDRFPTDVLSDVIRTHPLVVHDRRVCENAFYDSPDVFLDADRPTLDPDRALAGTADATRVARMLGEQKRHVARLTDAVETLTDADRSEVWTELVDAALDVLDPAVAGVWRYDDSHDLTREAMRGTRAATNPGLASWADELAWRAFTEGETVLREDVDERDDVESAVVLPLGAHGAFMAASTQHRVLDATEVDLARALAASAEAALDRAHRTELLRKHTQAGRD